MSQSLLKALPHLLVLATASHNLIKLIIHEADQDLIAALYEILQNVQEVKVVLSPTARRALYKNNPINKILKSKRRKAQLKRYGPKIIPVVLPSVLGQIYGCQKGIESQENNLSSESV